MIALKIIPCIINKENRVFTFVIDSNNIMFHQVIIMDAYKRTMMVHLICPDILYNIISYTKLVFFIFRVFLYLQSIKLTTLTRVVNTSIS